MAYARAGFVSGQAMSTNQIRSLSAHAAAFLDARAAFIDHFIDTAISLMPTHEAAIVRNALKNDRGGEYDSPILRRLLNAAESCLETIAAGKLDKNDYVHMQTLEAVDDVAVFIAESQAKIVAFRPRAVT